MPVKIPTYQQQVMPTLETSGAMTPLTVEQGNIGAGLEKVGAGTMQVADVVHQQEQQDAQAQLSKQLSNDKVNWLQYMQQAKDAAAPGAPNFTLDLLNNFDDYEQESLSKTADGPAKRFYAQQLDDFRATLASSAVTWEAAQKKAYNVDQYSQGSDAAARVVAMDPTQYGTTRASQLALINASSMDPETKARLSDQFKDTASTAAGMRMVTGNPQAAYAAMTQDPAKPLPAGYEWVGDLPPQKLTVLQSHAQTLIAQQQNQAESAQRAAENQAADVYNQMLGQINQGKPLDVAAQQRLTSATQGTLLQGAALKMIQDSASSTPFVSAPLRVQQQQLDRDEAASNRGTDPETLAVINMRRQQYSAAVEQAKTDPWSAAAQRNAIAGVPPVDTSSLDALTQSIGARMSAIGQVEDYVGRRVSPLRPDEAQAVLRMVTALPPDNKATALVSLGATLGDAGRIGALADQWKDKDPAVQLMMKSGVAMSGGPLRMQSGMTVAQYIADGDDAKKHGLVKIDDAAVTGLRAQISARIGDSLPAPMREDAINTAMFATMASMVTSKNTTTPSGTDIDTGINVATGGLVDGQALDASGNKIKIAKPWGWSDDDFASAVKSVMPGSVTSIDGAPVSAVHVNGHEIPVSDFAAKFPSYKIQRVGLDGSYIVMAGGRTVTDSNGRSVLVHLSRAPAQSNSSPATPVAGGAEFPSATDVVANPFL